MVKRGFTLIELLVTISIIAILAVIGLSAYGVFRKSARDGRRESDLKFIQSALEQYHGDQKYYPSQLNSPLKFGNKTYLNQVPVDPIPDTAKPYIYQPSGCSGTSCSGYCIYAKLETALEDKTEVNCTLHEGYNLGVTKP